MKTRKVSKAMVQNLEDQIQKIVSKTTAGKHTQGPWKQDNGSSVSAHGGFSESWNKQIPASEDRTLIASLNGNLDNWEANARLISSAPDLYMWAKDLCPRLRDLQKRGLRLGADMDDTVGMLEQAIDKAEGKNTEDSI